MLWYSFIFKHLHAEYSLWAWLVSPNTNAHLSFSFLFSSFFSFIYLIFWSEKMWKRKKERKRGCDSEWVWVNREEEKEAWIATKFIFAHFVVVTSCQKRCLALPLCDYYVHQFPLSSSLSKKMFIRTIVYCICNLCLYILYMWMYWNFFFFSSWYSFRLSRLNNFFSLPRNILVYGSWPRCIFEQYISTYGDPKAKRRKNRIGLFKRMRIHRKGKEFYPMQKA